MNKEEEYLKIINNIIPNNLMGDDCAVLDVEKPVISQDSLVEDVHFNLSFMTPKEIAQKALLSNISDILASGAKPKYFSLSLSGNIDSNFIKEFYSGIYEISSKYNLILSGGDLTFSSKILISIAIIGEGENRNLSKRKNAKKDYVVCTIGEFGSSAQGLWELEQGIKTSHFIDIHKKPILYPDVSEKIALSAKYPYAMMDSSDGLSNCLYNIANASNVGMDISFDKIPHKTTNKDFILYGGEDYSLVICLDKRDFNNIKGLTQIGTVTEEKGIFLDKTLLLNQSYEHF